ncbi:laccase [Mycena galericulata]|nr:laccase [Mycena galericulata]
MTFRLVYAALCLLPSALASTAPYELLLTNEWIQPDGFNRSSVLANKRFPGPLISAQKGDTLTINVVNNLTDTTMAQGTSIHWHGLFQAKTAAQDGVAWVTQCPISPGESFQYTVETGSQTGTYWYHSHITTQYCDGLRGPLVIYDPHDPLKSLYDVDDEGTILTIGDWYHVVSPEAFALVESDFPYPESTVINGLGRTPGGEKVPLETVNVSSGLRYRLRLINVACLSGFNVSIDSHSMDVIELDGTETYPRTVDVVSIWPGQRVSVIVEANQNVDNYWIRTVPWIAGVTPSNESDVNVAILHYAGAKVGAEPTTTQVGFDLLQEQDLVPLVTPPALGGNGEADIKINLDIGFDAALVRLTVNGNIYAPPSIPVLLQILSGAVNAHDIMPNGSVFSLPRDKLVEVTIPGGHPLAPHPFHLHGHNFQVIRSVGTDQDNFVDPPIRDVVNTGAALTDNVTFRFRTDNPGPWFLHCHLDWHLEAGLAVVFAEDPSGQIAGDSKEITPANWEALCPTWEALKTGKQFSVEDPVVPA